MHHRFYKITSYMHSRFTANIQPCIRLILPFGQKKLIFIFFDQILALYDISIICIIIQDAVQNYTPIKGVRLRLIDVRKLSINASLYHTGSPANLEQ